jgi:Protein of unknown function (DUF2505)
VKVVLDQPIGVSADQAQEALAQPSFYAALGSLPGISAPEVRRCERAGGHVHLVLGYRFSGELNGAARRVLDPSKLSWAQESDADLAARRTEVVMVPDHYRSLLAFRAVYTIAEDGPDRCCQRLSGELKVNLPLLGPLAERAIAGGVRENLAATARLVETYVRGPA